MSQGQLRYLGIRNFYSQQEIIEAQSYSAEVARLAEPSDSVGL